MDHVADRPGRPRGAQGCRQAARDLVTGSACLGCGVPGRWWCAACRVPGEARAARPDPRPVGLLPSVAASPYAGVVARAVVAHKDHGATELARPLGELLAVAVAGLLAALGPASTAGARVLLVPVPSRPAVVRARGGDPLLRVARLASAALRDGRVGGYGGGGDLTGQPSVRVARLLRHGGAAADQADLDAAGRAANLAGAFSCPATRLRRWGGVPALAVVVDDVMTTGATAREAQRALQSCGVPVRGCAVVAATDKRIPTSHEEIATGSGPATVPSTASRH